MVNNIHKTIVSIFLLVQFAEANSSGSSMRIDLMGANQSDCDQIQDRWSKKVLEIEKTMGMNPQQFKVSSEYFWACGQGHSHVCQSKCITNITSQNDSQTVQTASVIFRGSDSDKWCNQRAAELRAENNVVAVVIDRGVGFLRNSCELTSISLH